MTKYEWESELKKNIHRLPQEEIQKVLEYYDELFADKIEQGYGESEIVGQFGNPVDVADKILSEYDGDMKEDAHGVPVPDLRVEKAHAQEKEREKTLPKEETRAQSNSSPFAEIPLAKEDAPASLAPDKKQKSRLRGARLLAFALLNLFTGFVFFIAIATVWIVAASFVVAGGAMAVGGVAAAVWSLTSLASSAGAGIAQLGMSIALSGLGIVFLIACVKVVKWICAGTGKLFGAIGRWICPKGEVDA